MTKIKWFLLAALASAIAVPFARPAIAAEFADVLDTPAVRSELAVQSMMTGLTRAGERLIAVGQRGHILYSDDRGQHWQQAQVPVSSDLVAVHFPTSQKVGL